MVCGGGGWRESWSAKVEGVMVCGGGGSHGLRGWRESWSAGVEGVMVCMATRFMLLCQDALGSRGPAHQRPEKIRDVEGMAT